MTKSMRNLFQMIWTETELVWVTMWRVCSHSWIMQQSGVLLYQAFRSAGVGPVTHLDSGRPQGGLSPTVKACNQWNFTVSNPKAPNLH